jgi:hypothetical protein
MPQPRSETEAMDPGPRLIFERHDTPFYSASGDGIAETLLGLLCHSSAMKGSDVVLGSLTRAKATLLACYAPARVRAESADPRAVSLLSDRGVSVEIRDPHRATPASEAAVVSEMCDGAASPESFRDELKLHLLSGLRRGWLDRDWVTATPEAQLGAGGGGT